MRIFDYPDYKAFVLAQVHAMPKRGYGQFQKIAEALSIHSTRVSNIFRGSVHLTLEQASMLCKHLGLSPLETEYFLALVQLERAGSESLKKNIENQIRGIQERAQQLVHRVPRDQILTDTEKATFYSNWYYTALHLAPAIVEYQSIDAMAERMDLSRERVREVVDFFLATGLWLQDERGRFKLSSKMTHIEATSPLATRHHANWRLKAMQRHERLTPSEIAYTAPVSIARRDQKVIREMVSSFVEKFLAVVKASEPEEELACLNIDWFEIR